MLTTELTEKLTKAVQLRGFPVKRVVVGQPDSQSGGGSSPFPLIPNDGHITSDRRGWRDKMNPEPYLPEGWIGDDVSITCPHGNRTEWDGGLPCECENPLKKQGLI